jgi:hypothetical protein
VHKFVLENPLQCFQAVLAIKPANANTAVHLCEAIEQDAAGYRDLVAHRSVLRGETRGFAACLSHARRQPKSDVLPLQGLSAEACKKSLIVCSERKLKIQRMDHPEVCLLNPYFSPAIGKRPSFMA